MNTRALRLRPALAGIACLALAACDAYTDISATGNAPAQYSHVYLTISQVWFNASATAGPTSSGWSEFALSTPTTIDLVALTNGELAQFADQLKVTPGTYNQMRLVLADPSATLASSAQGAGALYNDEVDYLDSSGVTHQVPLGIPNSAEGIGIPMTLTVATSTGNGIGTQSSAPASDETTSSAPIATTSAIVDFDATRDLVPVSLSGTEGFMLVPHPSVYNANAAGTIAGAVALSGVAVSSTTGLPDVQVAAESVSSDGSRHVIVKTTMVNSSGGFTLYPLSTASDAPTSYDIVIHGPAIDTIIIKSVPIGSGAPGATTAELGTITPTSADSMTVNLSTSNPVSPTASSIGFYQTIPAAGEIPYLIEVRNVDPFSGVFEAAQSISAGSIQYGTFSGAGSAVALSTVTPSEGAATYHVAAFNSTYGTGPMTTTVTSAGTATASFTAAAIPLPAGTTTAAVSGTVTLASPGAYDAGELLLTQNGVVVAVAPLGPYLSGALTSGTLASDVPAGGANGSIYYAETWVWNSTDPLDTLNRQPYSGTIDLTSGSATGIALALP
ncbi:MAG TPA: DUF4382 domain-containing protein [Steroidobacteraceae bacterium]|nr:DUF4382 domain-containing protein [Steroidobacteraceae bacterium]